MQQRPCHAANMWVGRQLKKGANGQQFSATTSKDCLASDKFLIVNVYCQLNVFATATHILKLERYRED